MKKTVFIIVQLQFTVRYLLKTDIYKTLNGLGHKIVILSPNGNDNNFIKEHSLENVSFEKLEIEHYQKYTKKIFYRFFVQVRRLTLPAKYNISTISLKEEFLIERMRKLNLKSRLFYRFCIATARITRKWRSFSQLLIFLENTLYNKNAHKKLYEKYKPDAIILNDLGTIESSNFIMREAKHYGAKVISLILSWDNLTAKGVGCIKPDFAVAWNPIMSDELQDYHYLKRKNIYIGGIPHFDSYAKKLNSVDKINNKFFKNNKVDKFIYYGTGAPAWFTGNVNTIQLLINYIKSNNNKKIKLVLRPHPAYLARGKYNDELDSIIEIAKDNDSYIYLNLPDFIQRNIGFEFTETDQYLHEYFIRNCKVLITSYSTLMLEAAIFDKPIINIGFDASRSLPKYKTSIISLRETHLQKVLSNGFASDAENEEALSKLLDLHLSKPDRGKNKRNEVFDKYINFNFGTSGKKIAEEIDKYIFRQ